MTAGDNESAVEIRLLPELPIDRIADVGHAAEVFDSQDWGHILDTGHVALSPNVFFASPVRVTLISWWCKPASVRRRSRFVAPARGMSPLT
jgi:hypothetical protein